MRENNNRFVETFQETIRAIDAEELLVRWLFCESPRSFFTDSSLAMFRIPVDTLDARGAVVSALL